MKELLRNKILSSSFLSEQFLFSFIVFALFCDEYVCIDRKPHESLVMMLQSDNQWPYRYLHLISSLTQGTRMMKSKLCVNQY